MSMRTGRVFYGWWVVAGFSFMTFISTGIRHAVGPFLKPIVADLNLDRASFSAVIAVSLFLYGVFGPLVGLALDRFGARLTASVGTLLLVGSLVLTAQVHTFWQFAVVYGVILPLGLAVTGPVMASGVVARWFNKRRGTALSLLGSASMTGMSLLVPAVTWLLLNTGWRITYVVIAAGIVFLALRSAHGVPMLTDHGYTPMFASWALGVLGGSSIGFTVMLGALSDRFGRRPVLAAIYAGRVLIFAGFFLIRDNPTAILAVAVLGGITMAGTGSMTSALTADIYGRFSVSSVFGLIFLVHQTGSASGSALAGLLFETTGGYGAAFVLACIFLSGASVVALTIDKDARRIWRAATVTAAD